MKIRIRGASVRMRLSRSDVFRLVHEGRVEDATNFGAASFRYVVQKTETGEALRATFEGGAITMYVPQSLIHDWDRNEIVGIDAFMPIADTEPIYLLLEKDFQCIDATGEDQSDNYINPNQSC